MRLILNAPYDTPSTVLFKSMNWMSIESRFHFNISILVYKCLLILTPSYLNFFSVNNYRTRAATRSDLNIPYAKKKDIFNNSFRVQGDKIYNSLPCGIRESCSFNAFKRASFEHSMSKAFSLLWSFSLFLSPSCIIHLFLPFYLLHLLILILVI